MKVRLILTLMLLFLIIGCTNRAQTLIIKDLKQEYKLGSTINFKIKNATDKKVYCGISVEFENRKGNWREIVPNILQEKLSKSFIVTPLDSGEEKAFKWLDQRIPLSFIDNPQTSFASPQKGKYRFCMVVFAEKNKKLMTIYSKFFLLN